MLPDIIAARPLAPYRLFVRFEDGVEGTIDLQDFAPFEGVFESLRDPNEFAKVTVNADLGTVSWPSGADLDPLVVYARVTGREITTADTRLTIETRR